MNNPVETEESGNRLSLSPSPSRESNSSNLEDDLDFSSPNSSFGKDEKESGAVINQQASNQKSSNETSEEKRSSERENSSDRESTPDESREVSNKQTSPSPSQSPDATQGSAATPSTSTNPTTAPSTPSTSTSPTASTSAGPSSDKKRKSTHTDEEFQQLIKQFKKQDEERMKMQVLVSNFSEEQLNRYEMFRRATFPRAAIKRLMQTITGTTVSQNVVIAMSGISKVFVGEVLETASDVSEKWGDSGPLQPKHMREAVRILNAKGMLPTTKGKKCMF